MKIGKWILLHMAVLILSISFLEKGDVIFYMDTYVTPVGDMLHKVDHETISPYMDIELMDA